MIYKNQHSLLSAKQHFFLIYGSDEGKTYLIGNALQKKLNRDVKKFNGEELEKQPALLADEINSVSLFAESQLIIVDVRDSLSVKLQNQLLKTLEKNPQSKNFVLFLAYNLTPSSKIRKFFETKDFCAIMPCYMPDAKEVTTSLQQKLQSEQMSIDEDAKQLFLQKVTGNSYRIEQELNKLLLFKEKNAHITFSDIQQLIGKYDELQINDLVYAIFSGNRKEMENLLENNEIESIPVIFAIRRHLLLLTDINQICGDKKQNARTVIDQLRPPIFFKLKNDLNMQVRKWRRGKLLKFYRQTMDIELQVKWQPLIGNAMAKNLLLEIVAD